MSDASLTLLGNLGADAELKYTSQGTEKIELRIAINKYKKEDPPDWWRCTIWGKYAESINKLIEGGGLRKGDCVQVRGTPEISLYTNNQGNPTISLDLRVDKLTLAGKAQAKDGQQGGGHQTAQRPQRPQQAQRPIRQVQQSPDDDEELGF